MSIFRNQSHKLGEATHLPTLVLQAYSYTKGQQVGKYGQWVGYMIALNVV